MPGHLDRKQAHRLAGEQIQQLPSTGLETLVRGVPFVKGLSAVLGSCWLGTVSLQGQRRAVAWHWGTVRWLQGFGAGCLLLEKSV